ncbi:T9SS type A sorting domain-containing protein [bacterium]|nr:T9SS type A sorting domain-containing protein [bacterium]
MLPRRSVLVALAPCAVILLATSAAAFDGVSTDVAGFVGMAAQGPVGQPVPVTSYEEFVSIFGLTGSLEHPYLGPAVAAFFLGGGQSLRVVRAPGADPLELTGSEGLGALGTVDAVAIVAIPGVTDLAVQTAVIAHCEAHGDRIGILDPAARDDVVAVQAQRAALVATGGHAALYYPWIVAAPDGQERELPPSGFVAGLYAASRADASPIGVVATATGVTDPLTTDEADQLNGLGINPIRDFGPQGIRVWGARTLSSDPEWRYVTVRRTAMFLEESIHDGTEWAVLEPNDPALWQQLEVAVADFLYGLWLAGWFVGAQPDEAFFVRCDASTHTADDLDAGRTVILVGFAMLAPAEFNILRVEHERETGTAVPSLDAALDVSAAPNPFNPRTTLRVSVTTPGPLEIRIHDARGRLVRRLTRGPRPAGVAVVSWDGRDDRGHAVPSGSYLARVRAGSRAGTRSLMLVR